MKYYIGLGSNVGESLKNLEKAAQAISENFKSEIQTSPIFRNPALVPKGAPASWNIPFLNAALEFQTSESPQEVLKFLKLLEVRLGRTPKEKWAPREIDLDILLCENQVVHFVHHQNELQIPHPELTRRSFVLDPLKHLAPNLRIPEANCSVLQKSRALEKSQPVWVGILNLTPDSFSDGGAYANFEMFKSKVELYEESYVGVLDLGAESTRPGAIEVSSDEEWKRLAPALEYLKERYKNCFFKPVISVDTRHVGTARKVQSYAGMMNDVSGLLDKSWIQFLQQSTCDYVLMHSLSVPANPSMVLENTCDPVVELKKWLEDKLELLDRSHIDLNRVIFDPGIGFGKTPEQSLQILKRIKEFSEYPVRIYVGHSRKSFIKNIQLKAEAHAQDRDWESIGISLDLSRKNVDFLRVHEAHMHARAYYASQEV